MAEITNEELFIFVQPSQTDEAAFERIIEQYSDDVASLANRLLGWQGDVEDITQEVFLAAYIGLKKFRRQCRLFKPTVMPCGKGLVNYDYLIIGRILF
jgi:hypothetical protein